MIAKKEIIELSYDERFDTDEIIKRNHRVWRAKKKKRKEIVRVRACSNRPISFRFLKKYYEIETDRSRNE